MIHPPFLLLGPGQSKKRWRCDLHEGSWLEILQIICKPGSGHDKHPLVRELERIGAVKVSDTVWEIADRGEAYLLGMQLAGFNDGEIQFDVVVKNTGQDAF